MPQRPAKAPSPDRVERLHRKMERNNRADVTIKLNWKGRTYTLRQADLGPGDDLKCRSQTGSFIGGEGYALTGLMSRLAGGDVTRVGTDILCILLWTVRYKGGEPGLTFASVVEEVGSSMDLMRDLTMEVESEEPDAPGEGEPGESRPTGGLSSLSDLDSTPATA